MLYINIKAVVNIAKTEETKKLEKMIRVATSKMGVFGCEEVTIGWNGSERVDYLTVDTKGVWRCYEIKVSLADFKSKSKVTFCGNYNYYVLTDELYQKVREIIPPHIGVYVGMNCVKRAKRQELTVEDDVLKYSMIRSLYREASKRQPDDMQTKLRVRDNKIKRLETELLNTKLYKNDIQAELWEIRRRHGEA